MMWACTCRVWHEPVPLKKVFEAGRCKASHLCSDASELLSAAPAAWMMSSGPAAARRAWRPPESWRWESPSGPKPPGADADPDILVLMGTVKNTDLQLHPRTDGASPMSFTRPSSVQVHG